MEKGEKKLKDHMETASHALKFGSSMCSIAGEGSQGFTWEWNSSIMTGVLPDSPEGFSLAKTIDSRERQPTCIVCTPGEGHVF